MRSEWVDRATHPVKRALRWACWGVFGLAVTALLVYMGVGVYQNPKIAIFPGVMVLLGAFFALVEWVFEDDVEPFDDDAQ